MRILACFTLVASVLALQVSASGRVLVLLQSEAAESKYSQYVQGVRDAGFEVVVKAYKDSGLKLKEYDTWFYDHLIVLTPKAESFGGSVDLAGILEFIDSGRNVVVAGSSDLSDSIRSLAAEVGVDLDERGTKVFDHFNYAAAADGTVDHTLLAATDKVGSAVMVGAASQAPILFKGVASSVPKASSLVTVLLSAPYTSYSHDPRKALAEPPALLAGSGIALVSAVQARNNARVLVSGSSDLFSNAFFDAEVSLGPDGKKLGKSGNKAFTLASTLWTFQSTGVVKATNVRHRLLSALNASESPQGYRVLDEVEFSVQLTEYTHGKAGPFKADDMQVEFTMLDPHVRLPLMHDGEGTFSVRFKVPDVYGIFKYVIDYHHQGYSYIQVTEKVPVRPFKHNEYERFLTCAYPYYASALTSMLAFFSLGWFFLYHK